MTSPDAELQKNRRDAIGFKAGQFYPEADPLNLVPISTFGGVPNFAQIGWGFAASGVSSEGAPATPVNDIWGFTSKLTVVRGVHTMKTGLFVEQAWRSRWSNTSIYGTYDFGTNTSNPLNTGYAYGNAILGVFNSYTEANVRPQQRGRLGRVEYYAQCTASSRRRLQARTGTWSISSMR